ncbi:Putative DNA-binding protein [Alloactinosynnema sp. L-07]|uniref:DUF5753 domain-containing protein n=1 Tax=Alloactinosynnema sp. L-07 TaxID=1653480 RepID=UPI00065F0795|nr:DUF5753 domain-containing protein [Alloactinosynnema sp. L-07]CRK58349.1 Putative DNA-binding protein [Alloactinosynnema sp. L-07]
MSPKSIPPFRRRRLGRRIRELREAARMTLEVAAKQLDMTRFTLARLEKGENKMDVHIGRSMMDVYDCWDDDLLDQIRKAAPTGWWTKYGIRDRGYIDMETEATTVDTFQVVYVPGLLQTEDYMRAVFRSSRAGWSPDQIENQVAARLVRQRRLTDADFPLRLSVILDEAVLRRQVGGVCAMRAQLGYLVESATLGTVTLRVLPHTAGAHPGMDGAFSLLSFPEEDTEIAYVAYSTGAVHIERATEVREARLLFDQLRSMALSPLESVGFIEQVASD